MSTPHRIGVVGSGQMGQGIAQVAAQAGCDVVLVDADPVIAADAVSGIGAVLDTLVAKGKLAPAGRDATVGRLHAGVGLVDLADREVVIEAAPEIESLKLELFAELDRLTPPDAILASNTSSIPIGRIAAATGRADRVIGMHFMNPVPLMQLVEIIRGAATSDATLATITDLGAAWGKTTVRSTDTAGFIVNRMAMPFLNEAYWALAEGVGTAHDIDTGARLGLNHPMGPLELSDHIGLDTCLAVLDVLHRDLGHERFRPCPLLTEYVAQGRLGRKVGRGFYDYDEQGRPR